jgi:tetratricopeptide (TPR) repeat protein
MPFRIKVAAAGLVLSLVVIASWANSSRLYSYYSRFWHVSVRGESVAASIAQLRGVQKQYESRKEKISNRSARNDFTHEFSSDFSRRLDSAIRIHVPSSLPFAEMTDDVKELCRYAGMWFLEQGDTSKGCRLILRTIGEQVGRDEIVPFTAALESMFSAKMYSDIVFEAGERRFDSADEKYPLRVSVYYWYGVSLYQIKRHKEAVIQLQSAENAGFSDDDLFYYIAESLRAMKQIKEAIPYAQKASTGSPKNRRYRSLLVSLYNADGRRKDAERASRGF